MGANRTGKARPGPGENFPQPAPSPGAPVVLLPADTDPLNVASRDVPQYQSLEDNLAWLAAALHACPAILPASASSGYSATTYSTSPAFGGTLTPSGNVKINTGHNIVVQCTVPGAVATAKFKTSLDGGATYGAEQTTAASMTDATSGITFAFTGTLVFGGLAQFHSAFTPSIAMGEAASAVRGLFDFNGFPFARVIEGQESYLGNTAAITSSLSFLQGSCFRTQMTALGGEQVGFQVFNEVADARWTGQSALLTPGTANAARCGIETGGVLMAPKSTDNCILAVQVSIALQLVGASNQTATVGFCSDNTAAPRNTSSNGIWFQRASGGNWRAQMRVGGSTTVNVDTGIAPVAFTANRIRIYVFGAATAIGAAYGTGNGLMLFFMDEKLVGSATNHTLSGYSIFSEVVNTAGLGGSGILVVSPWRWVQTIHANVSF